MVMNHFTTIGLGTRKYQQDNEPVQYCEEMLIPGCDCCKIGPCVLCLTWTTDEREHKGEAPGDGTEWVGSAGGVSFRAYWDQSYCTINVELDDELVWSAALCDYEDATCRNFDNSVEFETYGGESGTFEWKRKTVLQTKRQEGETGPYAEHHCARSFCGDHCDCLCEELCVTVTEVVSGAGCTGIVPFTGEQCDTGHVIDPSWSGSIECTSGETVDIELKLARNNYDGGCIMFGTAVGNTYSLSSASRRIYQTSLGVTLRSGPVEVDGESYTVTALCASCGECASTSLCCPFDTFPDVLTLEFTAADICTGVVGEQVILTRIGAAEAWTGSLAMACGDDWTLTMRCPLTPPGDGTGNCSFFVLDYVMGGTVLCADQQNEIETDDGCSCDPICIPFTFEFGGQTECFCCPEETDLGFMTVKVTE